VGESDGLGIGQGCGVGAMAGINKTLDRADLRDPAIRPTAADMRRWTRRWRLAGLPLGVNGAVRRRWYVRWHKLWEYSRGLALTGASGPARRGGGPLHVLDVGGAMTLPIFYLASLGDRVVCLDIDPAMTAQTRALADARGLAVDARTDNLGEVSPSADQLGAPGEGFDRVYCFSVIEHIRPPEQGRVARRMGELVRPGGMLCITFDPADGRAGAARGHAVHHVRLRRARADGGTDAHAGRRPAAGRPDRAAAGGRRSGGQRSAVRAQPPPPRGAVHVWLDVLRASIALTGVRGR